MLARHALAASIPLCLLAGCVAAPAGGDGPDTEGPDVCVRAAETLAECTGEPAPEIADAECGPEAARDAEAVLAEGCDAVPPAGAKSDTFWCEGWRGDVLRKLGQCELPVLFPEPGERQAELEARYDRSTTRHPIVLAHGFSTGPENAWGFKGIPEALGGELADEDCGPEGLSARCYDGGGDGHDVYFAMVEPFDTVQVRAVSLASHIDHVLETHDADKVHLMAHSMGGLDCRDVIDRLGYGDRVASLTTVATTHHGTHVADVALGVAGGLDETYVDRAVDALARIIGGTFNDSSRSADLLGALESLTEQRARELNRTHRNDPRVQYVTWASVSDVPGLPFDEQRAIDACGGSDKAYWHPGHMDDTGWILRPAHFFVGHGTDYVPNDGLAAVESSRAFPDPDPAKADDNLRYRGCLPADHMDQVNSDRPNAESGFDHVRFWRNAALDLVVLEEGGEVRW